jgi:hypothetical protein
MIPISPRIISYFTGVIWEKFHFWSLIAKDLSLICTIERVALFTSPAYDIFRGSNLHRASDLSHLIVKNVDDDLNVEVECAQPE